MGQAYAPATKLGEPSSRLRVPGCFWPMPVSTVGECGPRRRIPLKGGGELRDEQRKKARQVFSSALYRLRAIREGLFGALKTKPVVFRKLRL